MNENTLMLIREVSHCEGSCVKDLIVNSYVKGAIVRLICEGSYCEAHNVPAGGVCTLILFHRPRWGSVHPHFMFQAPLGECVPHFYFPGFRQSTHIFSDTDRFVFGRLVSEPSSRPILEVIFFGGKYVFLLASILHTKTTHAAMSPDRAVTSRRASF